MLRHNSDAIFISARTPFVENDTSWHGQRTGNETILAAAGQPTSDLLTEVERCGRARSSVHNDRHRCSCGPAPGAGPFLLRRGSAPLNHSKGRRLKVEQKWRRRLARSLLFSPSRRTSRAVGDLVSSHTCSSSWSLHTSLLRSVSTLGQCTSRLFAFF